MSWLPVALFLIFAAVVSAMSWVHKRENQARFETQHREWHAQNPDAQPGQPPPPFAPSPKRGWSTAATMLAVIAAVGGLAVLGTVVLLFVVLSSGGFKLGNK